MTQYKILDNNNSVENTIKIKRKMGKNQNDKQGQQSASESNLQSTKTDTDSLQDGLNINIQDTANVEEETTSQRRPQFRLNENNKRRNF